MNLFVGGVMYSPPAITRGIDMARLGGSYELIDGVLTLKHRTQPAEQSADEKPAQPEMEWFDLDQSDDDTKQED
jgi:hypothetical protein